MCSEEEPEEQDGFKYQENPMIKSSRNPLINTTALGDLMMEAENSPRRFMEPDGLEPLQSFQLNAVKLSLAEAKVEVKNVVDLDDGILDGNFDLDEFSDDDDSSDMVNVENVKKGEVGNAAEKVKNHHEIKEEVEEQIEEEAIRDLEDL